MGRTGNDDLVPSVTLDNAGDRLELTFDDGHGLVGFALFEGFTDAGNDGETGVDGGLGLIKRFLEVSANCGEKRFGLGDAPCQRPTCRYRQTNSSSLNVPKSPNGHSHPSIAEARFHR